MKVNLIRYAIVYVLTAIAVAVILGLLERFAGWSSGTGSGTVVPALIAAMIEGQRQARSGVTGASASDLWRAAGLMTLAAALIGVVQMFALSMFAPDALMVLQFVSPVFAAVLIGFFLIFTLVVNRFGLSLGYRNEIKAMARRNGSE